MKTLTFCLIALLGLALPSSLQAEEAKASVIPSTHGFSVDQLAEGLRAALVTHYSLEGELQVDLLRPWSEPALSSSPYSVEIMEYPTKLASNVLVRVCLVSGNARSAEITLPLRLQLWRDALVTREPAHRDDLFDAASMDSRRVDALRERDAVFPSAVEGRYMFSRPVAAGHLLSWRELARRTLVRKGDLVEVDAISGALTVTMKGVALQNGSEGELIAVRNMESKRDIRGQVVGEKRIRVSF